MSNVTPINRRLNDDTGHDHLRPLPDPIAEFNVISALPGQSEHPGHAPVTEREIVARALCRFRRISETVVLDGRPIWELYLAEADAVLAALATRT